MSDATRVTLTSGGGALVASQVISAEGVMVQEVVCTNTSGATVYCQLANAATLPADATTPAIVFAVPAGASAAYDNAQGIYFDTGLVVCVSSTAHVKTISGAIAVFHTLTEA
jgi:hypothetical protein